MRSNPALRSEIIDLVGLIETSEARDFLVGVARSRTHWLVRYYAMRNLIDQGSEGWRPPSLRLLRSDFYASLDAYEKYCRKELDLDALHTLARSRSTWSGDHWAWLTELQPPKLVPA